MWVGKSLTRANIPIQHRDWPQGSEPTEGRFDLGRCLSSLGFCFSVDIDLAFWNGTVPCRLSFLSCRTTLNPSWETSQTCAVQSRIQDSGQGEAQAPSTLDATREAKQIRTRKSCCNNTEGNKQRAKQHGSEWDLAPFYFASPVASQCGWGLRKRFTLVQTQKAQLPRKKDTFSRQNMKR